MSNKFRSAWSDLFGSHELEIPVDPIKWVSGLETVNAELKMSLHDGKPPLLHLDWQREGGAVCFSTRLNLPAVDSFINDLIKHRDLLAKMSDNES